MKFKTALANSKDKRIKPNRIYEWSVGRQVDILINDGTDDWIIECKMWNTEIDVGVVDSFVGFLLDIRKNKAMLVTTLPAADSAYKRASAARTQGLEIQIRQLDLDFLKTTHVGNCDCPDTEIDIDTENINESHGLAIAGDCTDYREVFLQCLICC